MTDHNHYVNYSKENFYGYYIIIFCPFQANIRFLCPLKTSKNLWFPDIFWGYRNETFVPSILSNEQYGEYYVKVENCLFLRNCFEYVI